MDDRLYLVEEQILNKLWGRFVDVTDPERRRVLLTDTAKSVSPGITQKDIDELIKDITDISPIDKYVEDLSIEDVMINNTANVFVFRSKVGYEKMEYKFGTREELNRIVSKLKLYATNQEANGSIMDVHMYTGSRANIISSPLGYDVTIRNFKTEPLSIIDLINNRTIDYKIAARLWLYTDGFRIRPANLLIGGVPAAGKTTLLNTMFSFFRPEQRIVTIEETYELNTTGQENAVRLETSGDLQMVDLVKNALRMRPDMIIIGEVRGPEANDMISAMNIGKICMATIHASSSRDIIGRLEHSPMNVPKDILPVIDALMVSSVVYENGVPYRKVVQISEISGIETQILLSDIYKYDYKTHQAAPMLPSVTYRDLISKVIGVSPPDVLAEEVVRARILEQLNKLGKRDLQSISQTVKEYYDNPERLLAKIGLGQITPAIKI
jgi:archaeal flagellar protein FlaI